MMTAMEIQQIADRFGIVASRFCSIVDSAAKLERSDFASQVYRILPKLIDEAIALPDLELGDDAEPTREALRQRTAEWNQLYSGLKERLRDWDSYSQVFDPTTDTEAIHGSLADDIADIYRELKSVPFLTNRQGSQNLIWEWRFGFYSHWGKHAMDALLTIHFRLQNEAS